MIRYAIKRSDGRYMCIFLKKCNKETVQQTCNNNYVNCSVVKLELKEITKVSSKEQQEIRKQIYNEIKDKLRTHCDYDEKLGWYLPEEKIGLLIGQIEKGE